MDPDHQNVFVVAAVEDDDLTVARHLRMDSPEIVVSQLGRGRSLE
jgi:hypothetical protein